MGRTAYRLPPRRLTRALVVVCACATCAATDGAYAEKADREKPIFYQGDTGGANLGSKDGELAGNVVITQGTLTIHADRIVFHQNPDNSLSATAYGNPVSFREKRDNIDEYYEGFAQRIVYSGQTRLLELFDRALLKKSGDEIRSNYITYNAATEVFKAEGRPDSKPPDAGETPLGSRVRGVFQPQAKDDKGKEAKDSKDSKNAQGGKDTKDARDTKDAKDGKAAAPAPNPPVPLKGDTTLSPSPAR
jgi:lipopolysaccharide export system protein LptA